MKLEGNLFLQSAKELFWSALFDVDVWKEAAEELERFDRLSDTEFEAGVYIELGPIKGTQVIKLTYSNLVPVQSCDFLMTHSLVKEAKGTFEFKLPTEVTPSDLDDEPVPDEANTVLLYGMEIETGNPIFNAALETVKGKLKSDFESFLIKLEETARRKSN